MSSIGLLTKEKKLLHLSMLASGILLACVGIVIGPSFIVKHFRPTGIRAPSTVLEIHAVQMVLIVLGLGMSVFALLRMTGHPLGERIASRLTLKRCLFTLNSALLAILPLILSYDIVRISLMISIDYVEGWNAFHTAPLLHGGPLYPALAAFPTTPLNYPPLSYLLIGGLGYLTGDLVRSGRWISLISMLTVGLLVYKTIEMLTAKRSAAALGALLWIALMTGLANLYVATNDPQMLGSVFSIGALYLYVRWRDGLTLERITAMTFLCCVGLFTKQILITVPLGLAATLWFRNKRHFGMFAVMGIGIFAAMVLGSVGVFGRGSIVSVLEEGRGWSMLKMLHAVSHLMIAGAGAIFIVAAGVLILRWRDEWTVVVVYFALALLIGAYAAGSDGVSVNAWFDFFIATSLIVGVLASEWMRMEVPWARVIVGGVLLACLAPVAIGLRGPLAGVLDYGELKRADEMYREDAGLLRSIPGPALFEEPLLGYDAGKAFLFDPFLGSHLIASGRLPEHPLLDRIRAQFFGVVVLNADLEQALAALKQLGTDLHTSKIVLNDRWTGNTLLAINEYYQPVVRPGPHRFFFYIPRQAPTGS